MFELLLRIALFLLFAAVAVSLFFFFLPVLIVIVVAAILVKVLFGTNLIHYRKVTFGRGGRGNGRAENRSRQEETTGTAANEADYADIPPSRAVIDTVAVEVDDDDEKNRAESRH